MGVGGGGGLAEQGGDDAPDTRQLIATGGAWVVAVGAVWRRLALAVLLVVAVLAPMLALAGAGPLGPGALAALLVVIRAPILAAAALTGAGALAGAVGGLLGRPGSSRCACGRGRRAARSRRRSSGRSARWSRSSAAHLPAAGEHAGERKLHGCRLAGGGADPGPPGQGVAEAVGTVGVAGAARQPERLAAGGGAPGCRTGRTPRHESTEFDVNGPGVLALAQPNSIPIPPESQI